MSCNYSGPGRCECGQLGSANAKPKRVRKAKPAKTIVDHVVSTFNDVETIEDRCDDQEYFRSMQRQINSGLVWRLQGSTGRAAMRSIEDAHCMLGREDGRDYYGNHIPSRTQVQAGTKGSYEFVAEARGKGYADLLAAL